MNGSHGRYKQTNTLRECKLAGAWRLPAARCSLPAPKRVDVDVAVAVAVAVTMSRAGPIAARCHAVSGATRNSMQAKS